MIKNKVEGEGIAERIERKREIKQKIESINRKLERINVPSMTMSAGDARTRFNSFVSLNGGDENKIYENKKGEFQKLKEDMTAKEVAAKNAKKQHKELSSELSVLKKELLCLRSPAKISDFSIRGLRDFVLKFVSPWLERINSIEEGLNRLIIRRDSLKEELENPEIQSEDLDEETLLNIPIADYLSLKGEKRAGATRQAAVEDLLQRTELAIEQKKKQLQSEKKEFADDLAHAVDAYTNAGAIKTAQELDQMLKEDEEYDKIAKDLCYELLSKTKTEPVHVFEFTGGSLPAQTHIFQTNVLRDKVRKMVEETLREPI